MSDFLKKSMDTVAGIEVKNETQAIAKEVVLNYIEDSKKEKQNLIKYLEDNIKEIEVEVKKLEKKLEKDKDYLKMDMILLRRGLIYAYQEILDKIKEGNYE